MSKASDCDFCPYCGRLGCSGHCEDSRDEEARRRAGDVILGPAGWTKADLWGCAIIIVVAVFIIAAIILSTYLEVSGALSPRLGQ